MYEVKAQDLMRENTCSFFIIDVSDTFHVSGVEGKSTIFLRLDVQSRLIFQFIFKPHYEY